jgi:hypothetical protein
MTNTDMTTATASVQEQRVITAAVLGTIAFREGRPSVPCQDAALMDLLNGCVVGEGIAPLKAWVRSWHAANLAPEIS